MDIAHSYNSAITPTQEALVIYLSHLGYGEDVISLRSSLSLHTIRRLRKRLGLRKGKMESRKNPKVPELNSHLRGMETFIVDTCRLGWIAGRHKSKSLNVYLYGAMAKDRTRLYLYLSPECNTDMTSRFVSMLPSTEIYQSDLGPEFHDRGISDLVKNWIRVTKGIGKKWNRNPSCTLNSQIEQVWSKIKRMYTHELKALKDVSDVIQYRECTRITREFVRIMIKTGIDVKLEHYETRETQETYITSEERYTLNTEPHNEPITQQPLTTT